MAQVPAATRTLRVLRFLASQPDPVPLDRIARSCELPRSTAYHLLNAMIEERAKGRPPLVTDVGVRLPAHLTASGRAILARLPGTQVRALYARPDDFVDRHGTGPRTLSGLRTVLLDTRRRGYAVEDGDVTPGLASVAASVHDHNGHPVAGVAVTYEVGTPAAPSSRVEALAAEALRTAAALTRRIGGAAALSTRT